ncbi:MAG: hypothetical protein JEZ04_19220 [Spirochaetales bacterium]|nr:hypothetical protein [Spirochaetales bacterium]
MKSIIEILGGAYVFMEISYNIRKCFEDYLTDSNSTFLAMFRVLEEHLPNIICEAGHRPI